MPLPGCEGHGTRLFHGRRVRVQELRLAVHEEHRRAPPAELANLLGRDAPLQPAAVADGVDNRTLVETSLRQPLGALREVSYQLFKGDEILASAFERRDDQLCAARQLAELLWLLLEEVLSNFDVLRGLRAQRPPASRRGSCPPRRAP